MKFGQLIASCLPLFLTRFRYILASRSVDMLMKLGEISFFTEKQQDFETNCKVLYMFRFVSLSCIWFSLNCWKILIFQIISTYGNFSTFYKIWRFQFRSKIWRALFLLISKICKMLGLLFIFAILLNIECGRHACRRTVGKLSTTVC